MKIFKKVFDFITLRDQTKRIIELNEELVHQQRQALKRMINWIDLAEKNNGDNKVIIKVTKQYLKELIGQIK